MISQQYTLSKGSLFGHVKEAWERGTGPEEGHQPKKAQKPEGTEKLQSPEKESRGPEALKKDPDQKAKKTRSKPGQNHNKTLDMNPIQFL